MTGKGPVNLNTLLQLMEQVISCCSCLILEMKVGSVTDLCFYELRMEERQKLKHKQSKELTVHCGHRLNPCSLIAYLDFFTSVENDHIENKTSE